jgi:hypothetical protein
VKRSFPPLHAALVAAIALVGCSGGVGSPPCDTLITSEELAKLTGQPIEVQARAGDARSCDHLLRVGGKHRIEIDVQGIYPSADSRVSDLARDGGTVVPVRLGEAASIVTPAATLTDASVYGRFAWLVVRHCGVDVEISVDGELPLARDLTPVVDLVRPRLDSICHYAKKK